MFNITIRTVLRVTGKLWQGSEERKDKREAGEWREIGWLGELGLKCNKKKTWQTQQNDQSRVIPKQTHWRLHWRRLRKNCSLSERVERGKRREERQKCSELCWKMKMHSIIRTMGNHQSKEQKKKPRETQKNDDFPRKWGRKKHVAIIESFSRKWQKISS